MRNFTEYLDIREDYQAEAELTQFENEIFQIVEAKWKDKDKNPGKDVPKKKKSELVKRAKKGEDIFGGGKNFNKIADKASKRYGSKEKGDKVAGAIFWKKAGKKGMKHEQEELADDLLFIIEDCLDDVLYSLNNGQKPGIASYIWMSVLKGIKEGKEYDTIREECEKNHKGWKLSKFDFGKAKEKIKDKVKDKFKGKKEDEEEESDDED